ncbi:MAG: hypothetical protein ABIV50_11995, partial [Opitutus sp.]
FTVWSGEIVSEAGILLIALSLAWPASRYRWVVIGCFLAFLSGQLIFSNLYFVHSYYFYGSGLFLVAALGFSLSALLDAGVFAPRARWLIVAVVFVLQISAYARTYWDYQKKNKPVPETVPLLTAISKPDELIVVFGQDWDASFPYYAGRRALMLPSVREFDPEGIARSIARLDVSKVAAVLIDGARWRDTEFVRRAFGGLHLGERPLLFIQDLGVWVPESRQLAIRDEYDARRFPSFQLAAEENVSGKPRTLLAKQIQRRSEFGSFHPRPIRATAVNDFTAGEVELTPVISAHATTEFVFRPPTRVSRISAVFGIADGAFAGRDKTDGVEFVIVERRPDQSEKVLFRQLLVPALQSADRGLQKLDLAVEVAANTEVAFRSLPGPANNPSFDWSYWGEITLK